MGEHGVSLENMGNMENMENMEMFSGSPTEMFYEAKNILFPPDTPFTAFIATVEKS